MTDTIVTANKAHAPQPDAPTQHIEGRPTIHSQPPKGFERVFEAAQTGGAR